MASVHRLGKAAFRTLGVAAALAGCAAPAVAAAQEAPEDVFVTQRYFRDGRLVGMGASGEDVFFPYLNWDYQVASAPAMQAAQAWLDAFRDPSTPAGASLTDAQRAALARVQLRRTSTVTPAYRASRTVTGRYIEIPGDAAVYQLGLIGSLYSTIATGNGGFFNLFLMSELDWFGGKSPRWYNPAPYAQWAGYVASEYLPGDDMRYSGIVALTHGSMVLHEMCHHIEGHLDDPMLDLLGALDDAREAEQRKANELEADRCAAAIATRAGLPADLSALLNLSVAIVAGDAPSNTHPLSKERIEQAIGFRAAALDRLRTYDGPGAQPLTMSDDSYAAMIDDLWGTLMRYQALYAPPAE